MKIFYILCKWDVFDIFIGKCRNFKGRHKTRNIKNVELSTHLKFIIKALCNIMSFQTVQRCIPIIYKRY